MLFDHQMAERRGVTRLLRDVKWTIYGGHHNPFRWKWNLDCDRSIRRWTTTILKKECWGWLVDCELTEDSERWVPGVDDNWHDVYLYECIRQISLSCFAKRQIKVLIIIINLGELRIQSVHTFTNLYTSRGNVKRELEVMLLRRSVTVRFSTGKLNYKR